MHLFVIVVYLFLLLSAAAAPLPMDSFGGGFGSDFFNSNTGQNSRRRNTGRASRTRNPLFSNSNAESMFFDTEGMFSNRGTHAPNMGNTYSNMGSAFNTGSAFGRSSSNNRAGHGARPPREDVFDRIERETTRAFSNMANRDREATERFDRIDREATERFDRMDREVSERFDRMERESTERLAESDAQFSGMMSVDPFFSHSSPFFSHHSIEMPTSFRNLSIRTPNSATTSWTRDRTNRVRSSVPTNTYSGGSKVGFFGTRRVLTVARKSIYNDAFSEIALADPSDLKKPFKVVFNGEPGIDAGICSLF
jgi:hypothetical protein